MSSNELRDVDGFGVTFSSLYIGAQGCVLVLLENLRGMSCSGTCWPLGGVGFSVGMEVFDELLSVNVPWSQEFSGVLRIWTLLLVLVFSLIFTVVSRLLHLYSTIDKTSRLKMKSFSTVRDTQRGSQSYMEKRRGRRELEVTQMR